MPGNRVGLIAGAMWGAAIAVFTLLVTSAIS